MQERIVYPIDVLPRFAKEYFKKKQFIICHHVEGYGFSKYFLELPGTGLKGLLCCTRHKVASIAAYDLFVTLYDSSYYSDIVDFIRSFEKKYSGSNITLTHKKE